MCLKVLAVRSSNVKCSLDNALTVFSCVVCDLVLQL